VTVRWLKTARNNRFEQLDYIAADNPTAATRVDEEIERQTDLLAQYPNMGREGRVNGTRELVINRSPYIVVYRIKKDRIEIIRLLHGAQRWPQPATPKAPAPSSS
jgi:toxin ParE1/3/4